MVIGNDFTQPSVRLPKRGTLGSSQFGQSGVVSSRASAGAAARRDGVRNPAHAAQYPEGALR